MQRQPKPGADALALELDGNEDQRRAIRPGAVLRGPFQETEAQIEDVGAAFLECQLGGPVEIGKATFEFGLGDVGVKVATFHGVQNEVLASVLVLPVSE